MPETFWTVRWPDGGEERCYSPSSVVAEIFAPGTAYPLADFLALSREAMRRYGNQSSASVLFMLHDVMASGRPEPGDLGLMVALGPGFAAEMLTLSW